MDLKTDIKDEKNVNEEITNEIINENDYEEHVKDNKENHRAKRYNNHEQKNDKKKKIIIISCIVLILLILLAIFSTVFALVNSNSDKIIKGIYINGIDVSGLTKEEAKEKVEKICNEKLKNEINIRYEEYESKLNLTLIEAQYDVSKAVEKAFNIGRTGNIFQNNFTILNSKNKDVKIPISINEEDAINVIKDIAANIPGYVQEASYYIEDDNLIITKGKEGLSVDSDQFLKLIYNNLSNININQEDIIIPLVNSKPEVIDIDKIYEEVHKEAKDAYYTKEPFTIYPEVNGVDFDLEAARTLLQEDKEEYTIKLTITKPKKTTKDIGTEAFPDLLSSFSTKYNAGDVDRTTNLKLASNKINGTVLLPGEEFSYNKTVGERTIEAGYKEAPTFSGGKVVDGLGGGICQISSTLYDAVVFADLNVTVRRNHQFVPSYIKEGRDATVVWGSQDFKFVNTRKNPIRIVSSVSGGVATVSIYGVKEEVEYDISIDTKIISSIAFGTVYQEDKTLPAGTEKLLQNGASGKIVEAYKVKRLNGEIVSRTLLSKDTYNAKQKIILRGTAPVNPTTPSTPSIPTTPEVPTTPTTPEVPSTPSTVPDTSTETNPSDTGNSQNTQNENTQPEENTEGTN